MPNCTDNAANLKTFYLDVWLLQHALTLKRLSVGVSLYIDQTAFESADVRKPIRPPKLL